MVAKEAIYFHTANIFLIIFWSATFAQEPFKARWENKNGTSRKCEKCRFTNKGAPSRTRTNDPLITSQKLYQLSYGGLIVVQK